MEEQLLFELVGDEIWQLLPSQIHRLASHTSQMWDVVLGGENVMFLEADLSQSLNPCPFSCGCCFLSSISCLHLPLSLHFGGRREN